MRTVILTIIILFPNIKSSIIENENETEYENEDEDFDDQKLEISPRLINGISVTRVYPFMVSIQIKTRHVCGGSIIAPYWILTAAHCLYFRSGKTFPPSLCKIHRELILDAADVDYRDCETLIPHSDYQFGTMNDLGLIKVREPYTDPRLHISPVSESEAHKKITISTTAICTIMGWEKTAVSKFSKELVVAELYLLSARKCSYKIADVSPFSSFCVTKNNIGACHGDSGSSLVCYGKLYGIASYVIVDHVNYKCDPRYPSVYTRVDYYSEWIEGTMATGNQINPNIYLILFCFIYNTILYLLL